MGFLYETLTAGKSARVKLYNKNWIINYSAFGQGVPFSVQMRQNRKTGKYIKMKDVLVFNFHQALSLGIFMKLFLLFYLPVYLVISGSQLINKREHVSINARTFAINCYISYYLRFVKYFYLKYKNAFQYRPLWWPPLDVSTGGVPL